MVNELLFPRQKRLDTLFYLMAAFALLGPSFGIPVTSNFTLTFFRLAFVVLLGGIILQFVNQKRLEASFMYPIRWHIAFFVFWVFYALLTLTWVIDMGKGIRYLVFLTNMIALTVSFPYFIKTENYYRKILTVLFGVYLAIILFAVFESITLIHLPTSRGANLEGMPEIVRASVTSVFTNQNDLATCITLAMPFIIAAMIMLPLSRNMKLMLYGVSILSGYVLLATGSRANEMLALPMFVIVLLIAFWNSIDRSRFNLKNIFKNIALVLLAVIIMESMMATLLTPEGKRIAKDKLGSMIASVLDLKDAAGAADEDLPKTQGRSGESITVRVNLLKHGMEFLMKSHFMGVGAGNIERLMHPSPDHYVSEKVNKENIHNWWAEILVNFGIIVFVMYMLLYFWMLWRLWKLVSVKHSPILSPFIRFGAVSSLAAMIGYFFGGVAMSTAIHFTPMWISYGLALAVLLLGEREKQAQTEVKI